MTYDEYNLLPEEEKKLHQSHRKCDCGEHLIGQKGHSTGDLHVVCPKCKMCPDCEEGNV